jgi:hypothetical protein
VERLIRKYVRETLIAERALLTERELLEEGMFQDIITKIKEKGSSAASATKAFFKSLKQELAETKEGAAILVKMASGKELTPEEADALKQQAKDIAKGIPLLALFAVPGGGIATAVLVKVAKKYGINLMPTAFQEN